MREYIDLINNILSEDMNKPKRAGIIPIFIDAENEFVLAYCMIPSDANYGGTSPQMAKGKTGNMSVEDTAWKEAHEELGLLQRNTKGGLQKLGLYPYSGLKDSDEIAVFYVLVDDPDLWDEPHYETGWSGWINLTTDLEKIRSNQRRIFSDLLRKVKTA